jgi:hypothetical protein
MNARYGRWTVIGDVVRVGKKGKKYPCVCDCGTEALVWAPHLYTGRSLSCGCLRGEQIAERSLKHDQAHRGKRTPTYQTWASMLLRTRATHGDQFEKYGSRGITVCERWLVFENFLADMGERPRGKTIDRINNEGNYEPGNCRWATPSQQAFNTRTQKNNTSGTRGVWRSGSKWIASIGGRKTRQHLGTFDDQESAVRAYEDARRTREQAMLAETKNHTGGMTK